MDLLPEYTRTVGFLGRHVEKFSPLSFLSNAAIVAQLVDQDSRWWNTTLIDQDFLHFEVQKIKS